ncbi:MAG: fumarylacetoacetase [Thermoanaerobaculia bacterium]|nr:fumarylacetoacetase [Thermoanaerobaculia bacterium]
MTIELDFTHDPSRRSFVDAANDPTSDFPIQNLPLGVFLRGVERHVGIAIGDRIFDVTAAAGLFDGPVATAVSTGSLNAFMAMGRPAARALRQRASELLVRESELRSQVEPHLVSRHDATMLLPATIGDYTDFYASVHHATNVGSMFRPDAPLLPNYKWVPIGYHGRASSIVPSGTPIRRPSGQTKEEQRPAPQFGPSKRLDYELEVGCFVAGRNALGETLPIDDADDRIFGLCLLNDWSARDIQAWEYQPLGPFLAKNFATSVSPWVVTLDALAPFRAPLAPRAEGDPQPLPYLDAAGDRAAGGFDVTLEVAICSRRMRESDMPPWVVSRGSLLDVYWSFAQMLAHHASGGCNLEPGDLIGSGTVSGAAKDSRGCMLELTWRGSEPISLLSGEQRRFLEDFDEVILRGWCEREGYARIGFGECVGEVLPAT